ncbi:uncharacterized [Tachysurus ichikawai]
MLSMRLQYITPYVFGMYIHQQQGIQCASCKECKYQTGLGNKTVCDPSPCLKHAVPCNKPDGSLLPILEECRPKDQKGNKQQDSFAQQHSDSHKGSVTIERRQRGAKPQAHLQAQPLCCNKPGHSQSLRVTKLH